MIFLLYCGGNTKISKKKIVQFVRVLHLHVAVWSCVVDGSSTSVSGRVPRRDRRFAKQGREGG